MNAIRCNKCGNFVADNTRLCPYCGNPIAPMPPQPQPQHQPQPQPQNNSSNTTLLVIIILLLALIIGVLAWFLWGDKLLGSKEEPEQELVTPTTGTAAEDVETATIAVAEDAAETPAAPAPAAEVAPPAPAVQQAPAPVAPPPPVVRNRVANGTYRLNGAIMHKQNYYIDMELHVKGNQVSGQYIVYNGENVYVRLSGTVDANGNMRLTEYKNGVATGYYFTGTFNQATYAGKYKCTNRKLTMNFSASTY